MSLANDDACEKMISRPRPRQRNGGDTGVHRTQHSIQGNDGFFRSGGSFRSCLRRMGQKNCNDRLLPFIFSISGGDGSDGALLTDLLTILHDCGRAAYLKKMDKHYPLHILARIAWVLALDSAKSGSNY